MSDQLALFGGEASVRSSLGDIFSLPIITGEDEEAVLEVLRRGGMSDTDVTRKFEQEFAAWQGTELALGFNNGTFSLLAAMYGCGVGVWLSPGCNQALHTHSLFKTCDVYGHGKPTRIANSETDVRLFDETLPVSERIGTLTYSIPWFKKYDPILIGEHAAALRKVSEHYEELLAGDPGNPAKLGGWHFF